MTGLNQERSLIFIYAGHNVAGRQPTYGGQNPGWAVNPDSSVNVNFQFGQSMNVRVQFQDDSGTAPAFGNAGSYMFNGLEGVDNIDPNGSGISGFGPTTLPFGSTTQNTMFWSTFKSHNGNYLYYVVDQFSGRNYLVGYNISGRNLPDHDQYEAFLPHANNIGFEQIDVNGFNYENRFYAVPSLPGVTTQSGHDGARYVFFIASAAGSVTSPTNLDVYCFDADRGGDAIALTTAVTPGSSNAINHIFASMDGNTLVGQRSSFGGNSRNDRSTLNSNTDLFAVTNVHAVMDSGGAIVPNAFVVSAGQSHGASVGFVGDGTPAGAQAIVFSSVNVASVPDTGNRTWDDRQLKVGILTPGSGAQNLDATRSHYVVLAGARNVGDNPADEN
jgi:hypothetical protein